MNRLCSRLLPRRRTDHRHSNDWFDRSAARWLRHRQARIFVGEETCALHALRQAGRMGMKRVLDCPGVPSRVLDAEARRAAERFGVSIAPSSNSEAMLERKRLELAEADLVLCCSSYQRDRLLELHPGIPRTEVIPLWTDVDFWAQATTERTFSKPGAPLRVIYAGAVSLRKGLPYLLEAVEPMGEAVSLTMAGSVSVEMEAILERHRPHNLMPYLSKSDLRALLREHDVLVMPTLGDGFGFVTIEAMASGMPVVTTSNAGAPVPDESWRVPAHDSAALARRLSHYMDHRDALAVDGSRARDFGMTFRPEQYRRRAREVFHQMLAEDASRSR